MSNRSEASTRATRQVQVPILGRSELTESVFVITRYTAHADGVIEADEKYDVTGQYDRLVEPLRAEVERLRDLCRRAADSAEGYSLTGGVYAELREAGEA